MEAIRRNKQICHIPHEPSKPVYTFWDIGQGRDAMAIWFMQDINNQYRFFRYHESVSDEGWQYYANFLSSFGYVYAKHFFPHDGNKRQVLPQETITTKQIAEGLGIRPVKIIPRTTGFAAVQADIMNKCRIVLPRCWFDRDNCDEGLAHLDSYRKEWDDKIGDWKNKPRHDDASHCADAFRTFACGYDGRVAEMAGVPSLGDARGYGQPQYAKREYNMFD